MTEPTSVHDELAVLRRIVRIMETVNGPARDRIAGWVFDRYRDLPDDQKESTDAHES